MYRGRGKAVASENNAFLFVKRTPSFSWTGSATSRILATNFGMEAKLCFLALSSDWSFFFFY